MSPPLSHPLGSHQRLYLTPAPEAGCQQAEPVPPTVHGVLMTPARPQGQADPGPPPAWSACSAAEPLGSHPGNDISSTTADERPRHKGWDSGLSAATSAGQAAGDTPQRPLHLPGSCCLLPKRTVCEGVFVIVSIKTKRCLNLYRWDILYCIIRDTSNFMLNLNTLCDQNVWLT